MCYDLSTSMRKRKKQDFKDMELEHSKASSRDSSLSCCHYTNWNDCLYEGIKCLFFKN
jgi:hypothetical protein